MTLHPLPRLHHLNLTLPTGPSSTPSSGNSEQRSYFHADGSSDNFFQIRQGIQLFTVAIFASCGHAREPSSRHSARGRPKYAGPSLSSSPRVGTWNRPTLAGSFPSLVSVAMGARAWPSKTPTNATHIRPPLHWLCPLPFTLQTVVHDTPLSFSRFYKKHYCGYFS